MDKITKKVGSYWSEVTKTAVTRQALKLRWWQSPHIIRHINQLVCDKAIPGFSAGLVSKVRKLAPTSIPFQNGISVGGGSGQKEMTLIKQGLVESFDLYELSTERISAGRKLAQEWSLGENINFILGDAFELATEPEKYDFVHWNNSLHHMLDVDGAVAWSKKVLKAGGVFYMDDFIGSSRFQWPAEQLEIASKVRSAFAESKYLRNPRDPASMLSTKVLRPDKEKLIESDPSEAADSDRIMESVLKYFPNAEVKNTGGVIYHLALSDMLHNFDEEDDVILLNLLMIIDQLCAEMGNSHYGVALATKEMGSL